jgi:hypothetical protein
MFIAPKPQDPMVLSYLALRKAVGAVALALPFVLAIPYWLLGNHGLESSISYYYYTGMRNLFVGCLCAIAMFMLCARGYDIKDEVAGVFSSLCALGVAFFPTTPDGPVTKRQYAVGTAHYISAVLLFLTLAYFCLVLFKMTAAGQQLTPQKMKRNRVYTVCGYAIVGSLAFIVLIKLLLKHTYLIGHLGTLFCFETTALIAFGIAWLTKGETFLKDDVRATSALERDTTVGLP